MDASEIVLTAEGRQKLIEELEWREGEKSREIVEHIKEARAFGDLSENAEYDAAKEEQARNAARIAEIQAILANAKDASESDQDLIVSIGSTVALVDADGEVTEVTLVGTTETNSLQHKISNESPVGRAIIGHGAGETVEVVPATALPRLHHHQDLALGFRRNPSAHPPLEAYGPGGRFSFDARVLGDGEVP